MARIIEYIKIALMNIRGNKGRSFLTMLGIIIGISSVILIVSAGNGFKVGISGQLDELVYNPVHRRGVYPRARRARKRLAAEL